MKTLPLTILVTLLLTSGIRAEGPGLGPDKLYARGPVVLLRLTDEQKVFLATERATPLEAAMKLTPEQSAKIEQGFALKTTLLEVWDTRGGQSDCGCRSTNIALRFSEDFIEVLKDYLEPDAEAIALWKEFGEE